MTNTRLIRDPALQAAQPQLYENLTKMLSAEEQSVIQRLIMQANANEVTAATAANSPASPTHPPQGATNGA